MARLIVLYSVCIDPSCHSFLRIPPILLTSGMAGNWPITCWPDSQCTGIAAGNPAVIRSACLRVRGSGKSHHAPCIARNAASARSCPSTDAGQPGKWQGQQDGGELPTFRFASCLSLTFQVRLVCFAVRRKIYLGNRDASILAMPVAVNMRPFGNSRRLQFA